MTTEAQAKQAAVPAAEPRPQSAAAPSPFPPIADYAFLSNCHTGALVAPDGAIDWLCIPSFDAPSVFGSLLDRQAGTFRLAPFGINVPATRAYEPGTNTLVTTWHTPRGWVEVRDALTIGPRRREDTVTPHTRPPTDDDADHTLVRTVLCLEGSVEMELVCEPAFDYGRIPGEWSLVAGDRHTADATGAGQTFRLQTDMELGVEGDRVRARHGLAGRRAAVLLAVLGGGPRGAGDGRGGRRTARRDDALLARLAGAGAIPRPPLARAHPALGTGGQGPHLHADGCDRGGAHDLAARDTRRRAQLGLPLLLDARHHVHVAGPALAQPRLGGRRVHAVRRRPGAQRRRRACRSCTGSTDAAT